MKVVRYEARGRLHGHRCADSASWAAGCPHQDSPSGLCGTDLHLHHGTYIGVYPLTPGHETIGENNEAVTRARPGQQVTVNPNIYCGECAYCLAGQVGPMRQHRGYGGSSARLLRRVRHC